MPKPTEFPAASIPLVGDEVVPLVQSGVDAQTTPDEIISPALIAVSAVASDVADLGSEVEDLEESMIDTAELGTEVIISATVAGSPSPGLPGRLVVQTDNHGGTLKRDNGSTLAKVAAPINGPNALTFTAGASQFYGIPLSTSSAISNAAGNLFLARAFMQGRSYDRILVESTAAGAGTTWRLGYYPMAESGMPDWANAVNCGTVDMSVAASQRTITLDPVHTITEGWYWLAMLVDVFSAAPTVRTLNVMLDVMLPVLGTSGQAAGVRYSGVATGSLPTVLPATFAGGVSQMPCIWMRTSN